MCTVIKYLVPQILELYEKSTSSERSIFFFLCNNIWTFFYPIHIHIHVQINGTPSIHLQLETHLKHTTEWGDMNFFL